MRPAVPRGSLLIHLVDDLKALLDQGEVTSQVLRSHSSLWDADLWSDDGRRLVATSELISLTNALPTYAEALPMILSLIPELRIMWLGVVLGRLHETGKRNDVSSLCAIITTSGPLATELLAAHPSLTPTPFGELEQMVLPAAAHEAQAFPILLRVLAATAYSARLITTSSKPITNINWSDPSSAWCPGRLIRLPAAEETNPASAVLIGALNDSTGGSDSMRWVLQRPWAFLLGQIVFTKEAWEAERISGNLALELDQAYLTLFQHPPRVEVVVTLPSGEEIRCGSLAEFVLQVLAQLGVTIFAHRVSPTMLEGRLAAVVEALLRHAVWRFDHGTGGKRPGYAIHPSFSDACYRALGSRAFYRLGSPITATIRRVAETWARERISRAAPQMTAESTT